AYLIINRLRGEMPAELKAFAEKMDVPLLGSIPADDALAEFEFSGKPLVDLGDESPVYQAVAGIMKKIQ
ncbi:MAG: carbon monoxide dehydrogenase, partial [Chloroflexi bacterium]|nr:carbon monoxide dehydrogenase [Chloroflexota bacterium]